MKFQQMSLFEGSEQEWEDRKPQTEEEPDTRSEYDKFVDKFKPKKTTDDCYTPANIYKAVAGWVAKEYGISPVHFVRPFYPGGDFEAFDYKDTDVVVDNPPFSILSQIISFYCEHNICFFLFAPALTLFSSVRDGVCYLPCGVSVTYANGATVSTSFVTNLDNLRIRCVPELYEAIKAADDANRAEKTKQLPRYEYPSHVLQVHGGA